MNAVSHNSDAVIHCIFIIYNCNTLEVLAGYLYNYQQQYASQNVHPSFSLFYNLSPFKCRDAILISTTY